MRAQNHQAADKSASTISRAQDPPELDLEDELASNIRVNVSRSDSSTREPLQESRSGSERGGQPEHQSIDQDHQNVSTAMSNLGKMTEQESQWWAMSFEELYQHARSKNFGKKGKETRKSGRIRIIKWLCEKEGITPYVAPTNTSAVESTPVVARPTVRSTGAISHPEAILRTSDANLQSLIDEQEKEYQKWSAADLLALAMQRSYQLLKDSQGRLPSKSIAALSQWLAAWDVLKSEREKKWWLGDGIDLVNRAKAMGYQGPARKYEVIVWLRTTPEDSEVEVTKVAAPTPNKSSLKRKEEATKEVSKRHAKGSKRQKSDQPWGVMKFL